MQTVIILNGPNLNMLGKREPEIYGHESLSDIEQLCLQQAKKLGLHIDFRQSNDEGQLIDWIQQAPSSAGGLIINPGAYGHTSIALLDAVQSINLPVIEVHLSNIHKREEFRHQTFISRAAKGMICGFGSQSYLLGLIAMNNIINSNT